VLGWSPVLARQNRLLAIQIQERRRAEHELQHAYHALQLANESLEQRVAERTGELRQANASLTAEVEERKRAKPELCQTQGDLLEASRLAGMRMWLREGCTTRATRSPA